MASKQILEAYTERERAINEIKAIKAENETLRELIGAGVEVEGDGRLKGFSHAMTLIGKYRVEARQAQAERDKFERWFLAVAQDRDKAQEFCEALARGNHDFMEFIEAAEEARAGHSARLFGMLDAMKGTG